MNSNVVEREELSEIVIRAINFAALYLQNIFSEFNSNEKNYFDMYGWIKAELTSPSFEDFTFSYKNAIFPVLVNVIVDGKPLLRTKNKEKLCEECINYDLIPCVFEVIAERKSNNHEGGDLFDFKAASTGLNLKHATSGKYINPQDYADDSDTLMSEWELRNFAISVVKRYIEENEEFNLVACCDVIGIDPQIWFDDGSGKMSWVIVRFQSVLDESKASDFLDFTNGKGPIATLDGYFAPVTATMVDPVVYDLDGKIIPLSRRYDGSAPLYRGHELYVNFQGLIKIHNAE